jgi:TRAP-type transport system periplasmic protein
MPSLVTGVIDAVDVDIDIVSGLQMHKQAPYLALTNHMAFPGALLVSTRWWNDLDAPRAVDRTAEMARLMRSTALTVASRRR